MNGRIYDARLGRFLQADPIIQSPTDTASLNRYSYVWNNPLNSTDPTGFLSITNILDIVIAVVSIVVNIFVPGLGVAIWNAWMGIRAYVQLAEGLINAVSNGNYFSMFGAIGAGIDTYRSGGKFGRGFAAGLVRGLGRMIPAGNIAARIAVNAVVEGTATEISGGKFKNGAKSGAFGAAINGAVAGVDGYMNSSESVNAPEDLDSDGKLGPDRFSSEKMASIKREMALGADVSSYNKTGKVNHEDVAVYFEDKMRPIAEKYDIEIGAEIYAVGGRYYLGDPITDFYNHTVPSIGMSSLAGLNNGVEIHTHQTSGFYSPSDFQRSRRHDTVSYLSNDDGLYKFNAAAWARDYRSGKKVSSSNYYSKYNRASGNWYKQSVTR